MKKSIITSLILVVLLTSCSLPRMTPTPSTDEMPTRISALLTAMVTMTPQIETAVISTPTIPPATATPVPTETESPTPTEEVTPTEDMTTTPTVDLTAEASYTGTPVSTPTSPADDPAKTLGAATTVETFDNGNNWPIGSDDYTTAKIKDGKMVITGLTTKDGWRVSNVKGINYYVQVTGKMNTCSGKDHFGIMLRVPNPAVADRGYIFTVTCDGNYSLRKWNIDKMYSLIEYKASDAILQGSNQTNRIGVMAVGTKLTLYINGVKVSEFTDSDFTYGYYGIDIGGRETPNFTIELDELDAWSLK
jgi:hypothetical protein